MSKSQLKSKNCLKIFLNSLQKGFASAEVTHKSIYEIALDNLDKRIQQTKFQLCAALTDPTMCNMIYLGEEIDDRFEMTRSELLQYFIKKYKFEDLELEDLVSVDGSSGSDGSSLSATQNSVD